MVKIFQLNSSKKFSYILFKLFSFQQYYLLFTKTMQSTNSLPLFLLNVVNEELSIKFTFNCVT